MPGRTIRRRSASAHCDSSGGATIGRSGSPELNADRTDRFRRCPSARSPERFGAATSQRSTPEADAATGAREPDALAVADGRNPARPRGCLIVPPGNGGSDPRRRSDEGIPGQIHPAEVTNIAAGRGRAKRDQERDASSARCNHVRRRVSVSGAAVVDLVDAHGARCSGEAKTSVDVSSAPIERKATSAENSPLGPTRPA